MSSNKTIVYDSFMYWINNGKPSEEENNPDTDACQIQLEDNKDE